MFRFKAHDPWRNQYFDFFTDASNFFNTLGQDAGQVSHAVDQISTTLNPGSSSTGASATPTGGGIPIQVNLSTQTSQTINNLQQTVNSIKGPLIIFGIVIIILMIWSIF